MCGQNGGRNDRCLHAHSGNDGKRYRKGAFPKAGDILDGDDSFHFISLRSYAELRRKKRLPAESCSCAVAFLWYNNNA